MRQAVWLIVTRGFAGFGSAMTAFGLDVWVFQHTGSYQTFALLAALTYLPSIVLGPFTGGVVDRYNKRSLLLACELASMGAVAYALWRHASGSLDAVSVALVVLMLSISNQLRWTAMSVSISMLVSKTSLQRINGLQQSFQGATDMAAPVVGSLVLQLVGLNALLAIDLAICVLAVGSLLLLSAAALAPVARAGSSKSGAWADAALGFKWIAGNPRLLSLLSFICLYNLVGGVFSVSFTPYVLSIGSPQLLGIALGLNGMAAIAMGLVLSWWRGRTYPFVQVIGAAAAFGTLMIFWGWVRNPVGICVLSFVAGAISTLLIASLQTVWQSGVPIDVQGRVFAVRRAISYLLIPLAIFLSIPLSEQVLLPLVAQGGMSAGVWGSGNAGAIGMMLSLAGCALALGCVLYIGTSNLIRGGRLGGRNTSLPPVVRH